MKDLDWKNIINKVISWGFSATFAILGIALMAVHSKIDLPIYAGLTVALVGVIIYALTTVIENKVKQVTNDNKSLSQQVVDLTAEVAQLKKDVECMSKKLDNAQSTITKLQTENDRKQAKIDKLTKAEVNK